MAYLNTTSGPLQISCERKVSSAQRKVYDQGEILWTVWGCEGKAISPLKKQLKSVPLTLHDKKMIQGESILGSTEKTLSNEDSQCCQYSMYSHLQLLTESSAKTMQERRVPEVYVEKCC